MDTGTYDLKWGQELAEKISKQINTEIGRIRADPPLIPVVLTPSRYEDVVQSYRIAAPPPPAVVPGAPPVLHIKSIGSRNSKLSPIKISSHFVVAQHQLSDEALAARLAVRCARDLSNAEDDIILHGRNARLGVNVEDESDTLIEQDGLFPAAPVAIAARTKVIDSILAALQTLQTNNHYGPYCVIVSPDLHREALTPSGASATPPIDPILPQLRPRGFRWSQMLTTPRTGVAFSLGGGALDMPVLWDAHVECRNVEGRAAFVVVEQFRLRINDPTAVVPLS